MTRTTVVVLAAAVLVVALIVVALVLLVRFWRLRKQLAYLPDGAKWAFWGAVAYTLFPFDVLPDPVALDDIGVLVAASAYLHRLIRERDANRRRGTGLGGPGGPGEPGDYRDVRDVRRPAIEPARPDAARRRI